MGWVLWLSIPVVATAVAAFGSWLAARPRRSPDTPRAMRVHNDYLDALVQTARAKDDGPRAAPPG